MFPQSSQTINTLFFLIAFSILVIPFTSFGQSIENIRGQIEEQNKKIGDLEAEIAGFQKQLNVISGQKQTLQGAIATLDITRKKISAEITVTQNKISSANLTLDSLAHTITDTSESIDIQERAVAKSLRDLQASSDISTIEQLLGATTMGDAWVAVDRTTTISDALRRNVISLGETKTVLVDKQSIVSKTKEELSKLNQTLVSKKGEQDANRRAKEQLLSQTKATETTYQNLIATKRAQQKAFESELSALENSLKTIVDPSSIPRIGSGVLAWPVTQSFLQSCIGKASYLGNNFCITQFFGTTPFSTANPQVYNGAGHNAIDIGMPSGTAIIAPLSGTVTGTGNTDSIPGCYSYGKWILLKHANGLSTLYAHLSSLQVSAGQSVLTGTIIGYSGMTGYATGPHLHFGVYASEATQILTLAEYRGATSPCARASMPVAPKNAYLNPMSYL